MASQSDNLKRTLAWVFNSPDIPVETAIKFVIRWAGFQGESCSCPNCACSGCPCPLGVCFCRGISRSSGSPEADEGTATSWFEGDGVLHMVFDQTTHINHPELGNVVPVTGNVYFTTELAESFGFESVYIHPGFYAIDFSQYAYGEVIFVVTSEEL